MATGSKFQRLLIGDTVNGVSLHIDKTGKEFYRFVQLAELKNEISVIEKGGVYSSIEELQPHLLPNLPVCLSITGKDIIYKSIPVTQISNESELLEEVLPNVNEDEFCLQQIKGKEHYFLSVIRGTRIEEIINSFSAVGLFVVQVDLGPQHVGETLVMSGAEMASTINTGVANYEIEDDHLVACKISTGELEDENIDIGGEAIRKSELTAFSTAFRYLIGAGTQQPLAVRNSADEYFYKVLFKVSSIAAAAIIFCLLAVGVGLNYVNQSKLDGLNSRLAENKDQIVKVARLKQELKQKRESLFYLGLIESSRSSYFADCIAKTTPSNITLDLVEFNPIKRNKDQFEKVIRFEEETVIVEGQTPQSILLNDWIKKLNEYNWVNNIAITSYEQKPEKGIGEFALKISLKGTDVE